MLHNASEECFHQRGSFLGSFCTVVALLPFPVKFDYVEHSLSDSAQQTVAIMLGGNP